MVWEVSAAVRRSMGCARALTSHLQQSFVLAFLLAGLWPVGSVLAQAPVSRIQGASNIGVPGRDNADPSDGLAIAAVDVPSLSGTFAVEADIADGFTGSGLYESPPLTVSVARPRTRKVTVVGEVRVPGIYALSGSTSLIDALAMAGWTLPSAGGEAVIVPAGHESLVVLSSAEIERDSERAAGQSDTAVGRIRFDAPDSDVQSVRLALNDGDTVFVLPAGKVYVLGQVTRPGGYAMGRDTRTVLDGLALAGGATDLAASRIEIVRIVDGQSTRIKVNLSATLLPGDTVVVPRRRF